MFESLRAPAEALPIECSEITATTLPHDRTLSEIEYETATFGLG
ncbi:MAG: hypothetical protein P1U85_11730 [Verrucomicrobiales bacterium]|jgi:hypothetical protein|nr:hypothetical protein [Verrucomicrobiales bacterium]